MVKYTNENFQSDMQKLQNMLNGGGDEQAQDGGKKRKGKKKSSKGKKKSMKGGDCGAAATMSGGARPRSDKQEIRWFSLYSVDGKKLSKLQGRFRAYTTKLVKQKGKGRVLKEVNETPASAAKRAMKTLCTDKKGSCKLEFSLRETTSGSAHKIWTYVGERKKLPKPVVRKIKGGKTFTSTHYYEIKSKGGEEEK